MSMIRLWHFDLYCPENNVLKDSVRGGYESFGNHILWLLEIVSYLSNCMQSPFSKELLSWPKKLKSGFRE